MLLQLDGWLANTDFVVLWAVTLVSMALSLYIVFQAFRGYRRNDSRRMLYLAVGLALLTIAPVVLWFVAPWLGASLGLGLGPRLYAFFVPVSHRLIQIAGLCCILYSLLISPSRSD